MKLREEERRKRLEELRKERLAEDDETPAKDAKKLPGDETPASKEREKKKPFLAREKKKSGNRIKTAETSGKNYETLRGESEFPRFLRCIEGDDSWKRGTVDPWNLPSDSENELASPSEFPRESRSAGLCACSPGSSFYDEEGGRFLKEVSGRDGAAAGRDAAAHGAGGAGAGGRGGDAHAGADVVVELAAGGRGVEAAQWERAVEEAPRGRGGGRRGVQWVQWVQRTLRWTRVAPRSHRRGLQRGTQRPRPRNQRIGPAGKRVFGQWLCKWVCQWFCAWFCL